ncbi:SDR family NAD(P)-dependent oxidoreductase [Rhodopila sp.]|uniref:SDR family NAD(P)-dependent oxidoreductase n=1 Tax=Rhodopila sp. TaxID=2480087 RepID=UPI003D0A1551
MRNVVVTGGSRGIGLGVCQSLVRAGYRVVAVARTLSQELADAIRPHPNAWSYVEWDLSAIGTLSALSLRLRQTGPIYGLVNNAGIGTSGILSTMPNAQIVDLMTMNVVSPITLTKYLVRSMIGFTRSLAREVGVIGITVNAVAPGFIATDMTHGLNDKQRQQIERRSALHRMANLQDVANTVEFHLGDRALNVTGTVLTVDAGNTA